MLNRLRIRGTENPTKFRRVRLANGLGKFNAIDLSEGSFGSSFITLWDTTQTSTESPSTTQITLPSDSSGNNYLIEWGDGTFDSVFNTNTHTYSAPGVYEVRCIGVVTDWALSGGFVDSVKLREIIAWGGLTIERDRFFEVDMPHLIIRPNL